MQKDNCTIVYTRGGVEDTRLEAKAKDSLSEDRHSRGQGQGPRTQPQVFSKKKKKKGSSKKFSGNLQFVGVARIFDWGGLNHKSHAMTSSKICLLALNQDFAKREGLNYIVEKCKYVTLETFWESQCNSNISQTGIWGRGPQRPECLGVWGRSPSHWAIFCNFLEKQAILMPLNLISHMFRAIWMH